MKCLIPYLHTNGLKECWVPEWQLHHFFDLSQLLSHTSNVIVAYFIQRFFLILLTQTTAPPPPALLQTHNVIFCH